MQERCRLISESQWREYLELVTKCHRLVKQLEIATKALKKINRKYRFTVAQDVVYKALKEMKGLK